VVDAKGITVELLVDGERLRSCCIRDVRATPNADVLVELGFAMKSLGTSGCLVGYCPNFRSGNGSARSLVSQGGTSNWLKP
jgi:hypothetical protein